jgi:hypothetical protein
MSRSVLKMTTLKKSETIKIVISKVLNQRAVLIIKFINIIMKKNIFVFISYSKIVFVLVLFFYMFNGIEYFQYVLENFIFLHLIFTFFSLKYIFNS